MVHQVIQDHGTVAAHKSVFIEMGAGEAQAKVEPLANMVRTHSSTTTSISSYTIHLTTCHVSESSNLPIAH